jgi:DNA-binding NarL/FixJ family response regulator
MNSERKEPVSVLLVSSYELVRIGMMAQLLKMRPAIISDIVEIENAEEANEALAATHFPLVIIDESILNDQQFHEAKTFIEKADQSIVLCQLFREDEHASKLVEQSGASGYFFRSIEPDILVKDLERLIDGHGKAVEGIVLCR